VLSLHLFVLALTDGSVSDFVYLLTISLLVGLNATLFTYYWETSRAPLSTAAYTSGPFATIVAFFGLGCAACGSAFISIFLTNMGLAGADTFPLFQGLTLRLLGIGILLFGTATLFKKVRDPLVCPIMETGAESLG
jgi:hypothetical protein